MELHRPVGETPIALAHSLAGSSATVGFTDLSHLARALEHALTRSQAIGHGTDDEARLFVDAADEIRRLLHQFAAGFLKEPRARLLARLAEHELSSALRLEAATAASELAGRRRKRIRRPMPRSRVEPLMSLDIGRRLGRRGRSTSRRTTPSALDEAVPAQVDAAAATAAGRRQARRRTGRRGDRRGRCGRRAAPAVEAATVVQAPATSADAQAGAGRSATRSSVADEPADAARCPPSARWHRSLRSACPS